MRVGGSAGKGWPAGWQDERAVSTRRLSLCLHIFACRDSAAGNCSRTNSWQRVTTERESDGVDDADASSSRSFDDGSDVGVEVCAPSGSKTIGDFSKDDTRSQGLLGAVVGGRDVAIGDEDKQVLAEALDDPLELLP